MSNAPVRNRANPRRRLAGTAVLAAGLATAGLGTDGDRSSPNASDAAGPPPGPAAGAVRFVKHTETTWGHRIVRVAGAVQEVPSLGCLR
jgi:hypothetical protein